MSTETAVEPVVTVTESALGKILELRAAEDDPETLGLRIEVTGVRGADFSYDLAFEPLDEAEPDDVIYRAGDLPVMVPVGSVDDLKGATLDLPRHADQGGLVLRNPNRPKTPQLGEAIELEGTPEVNPAIAMHGGFTELVKVEDATAFITMGGGCQGCALSAMTLRQGIESAILGAVPEITEVVDLTDHGAGDNPFY
jgi:Fe/S biogenesis protein NfuA